MFLYGTNPKNGNKMTFNQSKTIEDIGKREEYVLAKRLNSIFAHPDCPVVFFPGDESRLARFVALRLSRVKGNRDDD